MILRHEQAVVDPEVRVDVGSVHLLEPHPDEGVFDALGGLAQDVDLAALDLFGVSFDVVFREFDVFPLRRSSGAPGDLADCLGGLDARHQLRDGALGQRDFADRRFRGARAIRDARVPRASPKSTSTLSMGASSASASASSAFASRVCGRIGVGVGGDLAAVDRAVALARVVRERDVDRAALEPRRADDLPHRDGVGVGSGLEGGLVEPDLGKPVGDVLAPLVGQRNRFVDTLADGDQSLVPRVRRRPR